MGGGRSGAGSGPGTASGGREGAGPGAASGGREVAGPGAASGGREGAGPGTASGGREGAGPGTASGGREGAGPGTATGGWEGAGPGTGRTVLIVLRKDLLLELRGLDTLPAMVLFAIVTFVIFHFGLNQDTISGQLAAGVLTVTLLFAAMLGINRLFVAEREQGGFEAFLLAPVDRSALLVAKALALFLFLAVLELIAVPAFGLLLLGPPLGPALPGLIAILALGNVALAVIGTLVSAIAVQTRARDLIGPIVGLPLLLPALIGVARGAGSVLAVHSSGSPPAKWVAILALYDVVFALLSYAVFDFLLED
jgi:heme exporter protein B